MSEKQRAATSWQGFLPEGAVVAAVVMARKRSLPVQAQIVLEGNPQAEVAFVGLGFEDFGGQAARDLFKKMLASISLNPEQILCVWLDPSQGTSVDQLDAQLSLSEGPASRLWVALETEPGMCVSGAKFHLPHPGRILRDASLKARAWDVLRGLAGGLGLQIPTRRRS